MSQTIKSANISLAEIIAKKARRARNPLDLLTFTLEEVIKHFEAKGGILFLPDNVGINPASIKKDEELKVSAELILAASMGLPKNYSLQVPIFIDDSIKKNKEMIHRTIDANFSEILSASDYCSTSFSMASKEEIFMQGIIYIFYNKGISITKKQQMSIEKELAEVCIILKIISDWHVHQKLVEFNKLGLTILDGNFLSNFLDQMLLSASEFIGCSGLSLFIKEPFLKKSEYSLAGTYPRKKPAEEIIYHTDDNSLTSKVLNFAQSCSVHYYKVPRNQIRNLSNSKWRDIEDESLSVMYIPIKNGDSIVGLLRCTNISTKNRPPYFNLIDISFAEVIASLIFTWLNAARKEEKYSLALIDISHEIKLTVAGIKSAAQFVINTIEKPGNSKEQLHKLSHIRLSGDTLIALLPALQKTKGNANVEDNKSETGFLPYADLCKPIAEMFRNAARQRKIDIYIEGSDQLGRMKASLEDYWHILLNLINNAVKYTFAENDIIVKLQRAGDGGEYAMIHVMSKSLPIQPYEKELIFRADYRAKYAVDAGTEGEGKGLMIARATARRMGGDVVFHNAEDYNIFTILLPAKLFPGGK